MSRGSKPLSILIAHPSGELYGSDKMLLESVIGLSSADTRLVVALPSTGALVQHLEKHGAEVVICPTPILRKSLLSPTGLLTLVKESMKGLVAGVAVVRKYKPDVVYVSTLTIPLWLFIAKVTRRPSVVHVHEAEGSASRPLRIALAAPLTLATSILVNSKYSATVQEQAISALQDRLVVLYNGVEGPPRRVCPREDLGRATKLVYVGRLSHRKGVDLAILALAELRRGGIEATLDIVGQVFPGNESYSRSLTSLVSKNRLSDCVRFHGFQSDVWPFIERADICLVTSRFDEPFGNTAVEALLSARPLVVSETSGLREAAGGYRSTEFFTPDHVDELVDAIRKIRATWNDRRDWVMRDAEQASIKHSLSTYRRLVLEEVARVADHSS